MSHPNVRIARFSSSREVPPLIGIVVYSTRVHSVFMFGDHSRNIDSSMVSLERHVSLYSTSLQSGLTPKSDLSADVCGRQRPDVHCGGVDAV